MRAAQPIQQTTPDPVRVLLVEADGQFAERVATALERMPWAYARLDHAANLREALARLRLEKFDVVVTALDLPDCGGFETLDEIARAFDRLIVVLGAQEEPGLRERAIAHGASALLAKEKVNEEALERLLKLAAAQSHSARSLRESEARFLKTFELAGSGIAHLDLDGRFLRVNRRLCEILGYPENELIGRAFRSFAHPDELQAGGAERRYVRKDGATVWAQVNAALVRDAAGEPHYEICVLEDITERKHVEARQAAHRRYQEAIARFGQAALARRDAAELVAEALETTKRALEARKVWYAEGERPDAHAGTVAVPVQREGAARGALCVDIATMSAEALAFLNTVASLLSTGLQRIDSEGRLSFLAQFDPLTGLANRVLLSDRLAELLVQAKRRGSPLAVLSVDLDDFNVVNEALGHAGGDEVLKETAMRLLEVVRSGDTVARVGSDEFILVLAELPRAEDAALVAQKVLDRIAQPFTLHAKETFVTASIGIAVFPRDGEAADPLVSAASAAMYRAKQSGRNAYRFFTSEIAQGTRTRARLAFELRRALELSEFALAYQPKIDLRSNRPCGAEALLRWHHPERGVLSPAQFVPMLEETGLIVPVGEWVIARACEDIKSWRAAGLKVLPVAVNLSARQFRQPYLDRRIRSLVHGAGIDTGLIELEITETQLMEDPDHAVRVMHALRDAGIRAAIDDFGTGYSSLAYLTRLPLAALKIDRSFVADALTDAADAAIVRTIIEMAHTLDFTVVAEGVETDGQMTFLRRFGCEQGQGFFFAAPMSAKDFTALI